MINRNPRITREIIRTREVELIFKDLPENCFNLALELGAGNGTQSRIMIKWACDLLSTDINFNRLIPKRNPNIDYQICDANKLPYKSEVFDLIYSSNLLEHISNPNQSLKEMHRVLKDDGIMIHIIPNRFWKLAHLLLFHLNQMLLLIEKITSTKHSIKKDKNPNNWTSIKQKSRLTKIFRKFWPNVHGEYKNHITEFIEMGYSNWNNNFTQSSFKIIGYIDNLPVHSPYRFGLHRIRKILENIGFSSSHGFVLAKKSSKTYPDLTFNLKNNL